MSNPFHCTNQEASDAYAHAISKLPKCKICGQYATRIDYHMREHENEKKIDIITPKLQDFLGQFSRF